MQSGWEIFTLCPVFYLTVGFNKLVSDLFHSYFGRKRVYQEKNEAITIAFFQEKNEAITIAPKHTIASEPFHMQYSRALECTSLTLHCKYSIKSLTDQCKLVSEEVKKTTESKEQ